MQTDTIPALAPGAVLAVTVPCPRCGAALPYRVKAQHRWYGWLFVAQRDQAPCACKHGTAGHAALRTEAIDQAKGLWEQ